MAAGPAIVAFLITGNFTHDYDSGQAYGELYGAGASDQSSFIGADAFLIPTLYAGTHGGPGCLHWSYGGQNAATSSLNVSFRLLQPATYSFAGIARVRPFFVIIQVTRTGAATAEIFRLEATAAGKIFRYSGALPPGDYTFDIAVHLEAPPPAGDQFAGLENTAFTLTTIPEPTTCLFAACLGTAAFFRRRRHGELT